MDNTKNTNVYIIDIDAEKLANPNRDIEVEKLNERFREDYLKMIAPSFDVGSRDDLVDIITNNYDFIDQNDLVDILTEEYPFYDEELWEVYWARLMKGEKLIDEMDVETNPVTNSYEIKEKERDSLYISSLPVSLDLLKLKRLFPKEIYTKNKKTGSEKLYTDAIINVTFDDASYVMVDKIKLVNKVKKNTVKTIPVYDDKKNMTTRDLREKLYSEGVTL